MKLQNLTVIFVIIIIPVVLLVSLYITNGLKTIKYQAIYDSGLLTATHDAIYAFELNTTNDAYSDNAETKRNILKSSVKAFERSLCNTCGISSFNTKEIEEYIPAIMFGMYDGFYMYAPSLNSNGTYEHSLKNYVYYSEKINGKYGDIIVRYSLDSYITVSGVFNGTNYETKEGYLIVGSNEAGTQYKGITIDSTDSAAIKYYREAYTFTEFINKMITDAVIRDADYLKISESNDPESESNDPEDENSAFTKHKKEVMKNKIEQVLNSTITAYSERTTNTTVYKMPKLNAYDWEKIYSNISMVAFFQGKNIGLTNYNGYCVLNSTNSNEYVNPNLMYFIEGDTYHDIRCEDMGNISNYSKGYRIGAFQKTKTATTNDNGETTYLYTYKYYENACYKCINGQISSNESVYDYVRNSETNEKVKSSYFTSLARERYNTVKLLKIENRNNILKENLNVILSEAENTKLYDDFGNRITVPAGFKVVVDNTTGYNADTIDVTKGIVIEDVQNGNQFVWIPVGEIFTNVGKTESKTITLGRYSNFTKNSEGKYTSVQTATNYAERKDINLTGGEGSEGNTCFEDASNNDTDAHYNARNLRAFCLSANQNGGYYIGRYEASKKTNSDEVVLKENVANKIITYTGLGEVDASIKCREMYSTDKFESDLTNSYAYDTALIFIQEFAQPDYATKKVKFLLDSYDDKQLNIYNMNGGYIEWSTEISTYSGYPWIKRGTLSYYYGDTVDVASRRCDYDNLSGYSFRPILYLK